MGKLRRSPFRCRGCHNRFYVYIRQDSDEVEESAEAAETPEAETGQQDGEGVHKPDVAKPAEP
jgi:pyruvate-formate lyase-activating enzyme